MRYKLMRRFKNEYADRQIAAFEDLADARVLAEHKVIEAKRLNTHVIYKIVEFDEVLFDSERDAISEPESSQSGAKSSSNFRPTPFNTNLQPGSMPKKWIVNGDDDKEKKS